jgi:hypothetical protein
MDITGAKVVGTPEGKRPLGSYRHRRKNNND